MSYKYDEIKPRIFLEENQKLFLGIRDRFQELFTLAGAARLETALMRFAGDTWIMLACVDRLVELGEIREIPTNDATQNRIFVKA